MRLWSLHPKYLDAKGLVTVWREGLLARKVLQGKTLGYTHHPQLERFRAQKNPVGSIERYLHAICDEGSLRGYNFNRNKLGRIRSSRRLTVTTQQLAYELGHLKKKLWKRDRTRVESLRRLKTVLAHPLFKIVRGGIEKWERI
jgi:hypothetical protein